MVSGEIKVNIGHKMSTYEVLLKGVEIAICTQMAPAKLPPGKKHCIKDMIKLRPGEVE